MIVKYASVEKLREVCDPFRRVCWSLDLSKPLTPDEVLHAEPVAPSRRWQGWKPQPCLRADHAGRIRWLMEHGWRKPIAVDVGIPSMGCHVEWPILDGNHRFAAAILRGDTKIRADFAGETRLIRRFAA